jgi:allophanate hydrolase
MSLAILRVIQSGFFTTVQDEGRFGHRLSGVPVTGALDGIGLALANALVGNAREEACLELIGMGPVLDVMAESVRVALVGDGRIEQSGSETMTVPAGQSLRALKGDRLRVVLGGGSFTSYLTVEGGIAVPRVLGSRSTDARADFGGYQGRPLRDGDEIPGTVEAVGEREERAFAAPRDMAGPIRVVLGPQEDYFTDDAIATFLASSFTIAPASNRMGFRLTGVALQHKGAVDIASDGTAPGAIQVPGSGEPIILMADSQTVGGYPKIATVIAADLPRLAGHVAGAQISFKAVSQADAVALRRDAERALAAMIADFRAVAAPRTINLTALAQANLISGIVDSGET